MPAVPLPFILTGILVLVFLRLARRGQRGRGFLLFVAAAAAQSALVGLRWSTGLGPVRFVQPALAACLPPLALGAFVSLSDRKFALWHGLWPVAVIVAWWLAPSAIDPLVIAEFAIYGVLVLRLDRGGDTLPEVRIGDEWTVARARSGVAAMLLLSAATDAVVSVALADGDQAVAVPTIAAMTGIVLVGLAAGLLGQAAETRPVETDEQAPAEAASSSGTDEDRAVLAAVEAVLARGLYRDYDLTLRRLSRRTGIPARNISRAVNRLHGRTVTDLVNGHRVREAMRLLRESDLPVTRIMLEAGFQTKSNFNRAFKEIAGQTPSDYRTSGSR